MTDYPYAEAEYKGTMFYRTAILFLLIKLIIVGLEAPTAMATPPAGYQLTWQDEFNGNSLDTTEWLYRADEKHQSIQLPSNVEVSGGNLILNLTPLATPINGFDSAGAGVITRDRFRYGYYETRSRLGDGINDDGDGLVDEGWHHAFWAQLAEEAPGGTVSTTFPSIRRTEIDGYENDSTNLNRMTQHVLPWSEQGQIITRIPADDVTEFAPGTQSDWHTHGFEWTPNQVRFYVDDVLTKVADYSYDSWEHTDVNLWLTAISANWSDSDQELSEARYDYFRFYSPSDTVLSSGEQYAIGIDTEFGGSVGGTLVTGNFGGSSSITGTFGGGGVAGNVNAGSGSTAHGVGTLFGNMVAESGSRVRVGGQGIALSAGGAGAITTTEDFESFAPGDAFVNGSSTGLTPTWNYHDLGSTTTDAHFVISGADGTTNEPTEASLTGESQMLFQRATSIDFATEVGGSQPFVGALAIGDGFDTSKAVDIIETDLVFDGYGDGSGNNLDSKLVFGFQDTDNWLALSIVAGGSTGSSTQVDLTANIAGDRQNVFSRAGTSVFNGNFPQDKLLRARVAHDASQGYVEFSITDPSTGEVLAESYVIDDRFMVDGKVGFGVNNDATGYDNFVVTTQDTLPISVLQSLTVQGDYTQQAGAILEVDLGDDTVYDRLVVDGAALLDGVLEVGAQASFDEDYGVVFDLLTATNGVSGAFDSVVMPTMAAGKALKLVYGANSVSAEVVLAGDFNEDGKVDAADYTNWRDSLGTNVLAGTLGDQNGDGVIGNEEYTIWRDNYNASLPLPAVSIPEPSTMMLICLSLGLTAVRARD